MVEKKLEFTSWYILVGMLLHIRASAKSWPLETPNKLQLKMMPLQKLLEYSQKVLALFDKDNWKEMFAPESETDIVQSVGLLKDSTDELAAVLAD